MRDIDNYTEKYLGYNDFEKYQVIYRRRKILEYIEKYNHDSILEIGCGMEPIGKYINDYKLYTIVEPSHEFCQNASKVLDNSENVKIIEGFFENKTNVLGGGTFR